MMPSKRDSDAPSLPEFDKASSASDWFRLDSSSDNFFRSRSQARPAREPSPHPAFPGYEILDEIGRSGMTVLFKARQTEPNRLVTLEWTQAIDAGDRSARERFRREVQ